jgi:chromosomal replication initiator protein
MSKLWQDALAQLEASLNPQYFSTWIKPLRLVRIDRDLVVLEVPNRFVLDWVRDNYPAGTF